MSNDLGDLPRVPGGCPPENALRTFTRKQVVISIVCGLALVALALFDSYRTALAVNTLLIIFYVAFTLYKLALMNISILKNQEIRPTADEMASLHDEDLPTYTILVPLYHETGTLKQLTDAIDRLDYPKNRLDVKLLMEEDDADTIALCRTLPLGSHYECIILPHSLPKTKPKACNIGLERARGRFLVIYDAEDRPEPDQLKKSIAAFRKLPDHIACLQAKLNFYNPHQNLLTRWFTLEYSAWFDLYLPGLAAVDAPIPLGGTSNHFRTDVLRAVGGWDPFNVAEDCDLGIRLYKAGYRTRILDSTTWEEACSSLYFWIRQRTRWSKGYMQTFLVHTRQHTQLFRILGLKSFLNFHFIFGGTLFCTLINPIYWAMLVAWLAWRPAFLTMLFPAPVMVLGMLCLLGGNFVFIYAGTAACLQRRNFRLVKLSLIVPLYWVLMSLASWRALFQLFYNPYHWEKTRHGLFLEKGTPAHETGPIPS